MRNLLLLLAACASAPPAAAPEPIPLDAADASPAAALFLQHPDDVARFHAFVEQVRTREPATFQFEHAGREGGTVVEHVAWDGERYDYTDGTRRLLCLYLSGTRLSGCRAAELQAAPVDDGGMKALEDL